MGPACLGHFRDTQVRRGPLPQTGGEGGGVALHLCKLLALFPALQTLVGKDGEAVLGPVSRGLWRGYARNR